MKTILKNITVRAAVCHGIVSVRLAAIPALPTLMCRAMSASLADGRPDAAVAVIREKIPFPSVCGLVCFPSLRSKMSSRAA